MTPPVLVLVPAHSTAPAMAGSEVVVYATAVDIAAALAAHPGAPAVLWSDGLAPGEVPGGVAGRASGVIEVRSARWDGATPSPLSAVCRGVVAGFGLRGVVAAVALLTGEP